jgi:hypothetical protein
MTRSSIRRTTRLPREIHSSMTDAHRDVIAPLLCWNAQRTVPHVLILSHVCMFAASSLTVSDSVTGGMQLIHRFDTVLIRSLIMSLIRHCQRSS